MSVKRRTNTEWRKLVAEYEASGMTQEQWCLANGINFYTFKDRAMRLRKMDEKGVVGPIFRSKAKNGWVEVTEPASDRAAESDPAEEPPCLGEIRIMVGGFTILVTDGFSDVTFTRVINAFKAVTS